MYKNSLEAIKRANRYRERTIFNDNLLDFSSNDYLGLSEKRLLLKRACKRVGKYKYHSPKASMLVNGYHPIHYEFEKKISSLNGFEDGIVVGSGFLANLSLIETLTRKGDILILDQFYHASGIFASKVLSSKVLFFKHNDSEELERILSSESYNRAIVAIEGIYSMEGDLAKREIFTICDKYNAILIVDEAHSSGVVGKNLLGIFDLYNIKPKSNHIKMGTLGKAYGSYGAYILASKEIIDFLQNRAKAIIYTTALSLFDTALALEGISYINKKRDKYQKKITFIRELIKRELNREMEGLIIKIEINSSKRVLEIKEKLLEKGYIVGAIRPPTIQKAILRIIPRVNIKKRFLKRFISDLKGLI